MTSEKRMQAKTNTQQQEVPMLQLGTHGDPLINKQAMTVMLGQHDSYISFGYHKYSSVSHMLTDLGMPSFNTLIFNANLMCDNRLKSSVNSLVQTVFLV